MLATPDPTEVEINHTLPQIRMTCPYHNWEKGKLLLEPAFGTFRCNGCGVEGRIIKITAIIERTGRFKKNIKRE